MANPVSPGASGRWKWRVFGPLNGTIFVVAGAYILIGTLTCHEINLGLPNFGGPWALTRWSGQYSFMLFALTIGIYNSTQMATLSMRIAYVILTVGFAFAAGQAAEFHVGVHAAQWGSLAFAALLMLGVVWFLDARVRQASDRTDRRAQQKPLRTTMTKIRMKSGADCFADVKTVRHVLLMYMAFGVLKRKRLSRGMSFEFDPFHELATEIRCVLADLDSAMSQWRIVAENDTREPRARTRESRVGRGKPKSWRW